MVRKPEFHHTPKHGSWLNVAECELGVLATQCLDRRLPDLATVAREVAVWEARRNRERPTIRWPFTTIHARRKLKRLYRFTTSQASIEDRGFLMRQIASHYPEVAASESGIVVDTP